MNNHHRTSNRLTPNQPTERIQERHATRSPAHPPHAARPKPPPRLRRPSPALPRLRRRRDLHRPPHADQHRDGNERRRRGGRDHDPTPATAEPLHRAALALHAGLALDALARAAPLRSAAAAARAGRAARLLASAAAGLRAAYGFGDGGDEGERREGEDGKGVERRTGGWAGGEAAAADALRWRARVERFRRGVGGLIGTLETLARSAERWRDKVLDWQERHGVVVSKEELAAAARDLHGSLW